MYIEPNSDFYILRDVPLQNNYENTVYFATEAEQYIYFNSKKKFALTRQTYQRYTDNTMRVQLKADDLYDCNYIMFRNTAYGNKWFYAFIVSVEYVNNITSTIAFALDVMQTYHFDYTLGECFVEREHSATDEIGENTIPENLEIGGYQTNATASFKPLSYNVFVYTTDPVEPTPEYVLVPQLLYYGQPLTCYAYECGPSITPSTYDRVKDIIEKLTSQQKKDGVVDVFLQPVWNASDGIAPAGTDSSVNLPTRRLPIPVKNNKLYTFPYCVCAIQCEGQGQTFRYEWFTDPKQPTVAMNWTFGPNSQMSVIPLNYCGLDKYVPGEMVIDGFPSLPWVTDSYTDWISKNKAQIIASAVGGAADFAASVGQIYLNKGRVAPQNYAEEIELKQRVRYSLEDTVLQGLADLVGATANLVAQDYNASNLPNEMVGSAAAGEVNVYNRVKGVYAYSQSITPEYIQIVDDYFSKYGYATHRLKVPNRYVRNFWTFTKTVGAVIKGSLPAEVKNAIRAVYDNGVTFWASPAFVGDYSQDNEPLIQEASEV